MAKHKAVRPEGYDIRNVYEVVRFFDLELTQHISRHPAHQYRLVYELGVTSRPIVRNNGDLSEHTVDDVIDALGVIFDYDKLSEHERVELDAYLDWWHEFTSEWGLEDKIDLSEKALTEYWDVFPERYKTAILSVGSGYMELFD